MRSTASQHSSSAHISQSTNSSNLLQSKWVWLGMAAMVTLMIASLFILFLGVQIEDAAGESKIGEDAMQGRAVTFGSVIKLQHDRTKFRLHSHEVPYGSGSGQQSVTGFPGGEDANSYWIVKPPIGTSVSQGDEIPSGTALRLQHMKTKRWLHSHLHQSPISGNYEVSGFGADDQSDTGDIWWLEIEGKGNIWLRDQKVRLQHADTGGYLHSHDKKYSRIVPGQQEVCGVLKKSPDNQWIAAEGVYFPKRSSSESS